VNTDWLIGWEREIIRHNGNAVPWDDDVDVYMLRQDWDKAEKILPELFKDTDFGIINRGFSLKFVRFRKVGISFDIFPIDQYYKKLDSLKEREELPEKICSAGLYSRSDWENATGCPRESEQYWNGVTIKTPEEIARIKQESKAKWKKDFMQGRQPACNGHLVVGFERAGFQNKDYTYTWDYDWVFPLKRSTFMGVETNIPNDPDLYLRSQYGDYWTLPTIFQQHASQQKMTPERVVSLIELANLDVPEFVKGLNLLPNK